MDALIVDPSEDPWIYHVVTLEYGENKPSSSMLYHHKLLNVTHGMRWLNRRRLFNCWSYVYITILEYYCFKLLYRGVGS